MNNKTTIQNATRQFREETSKLVAELSKKREKSTSPSTPINAKEITTGQQEFSQLVAKRIEQFSKTKDYLNYLGATQEDTITA